jgi:PleD family two-component response regulator
MITTQAKNYYSYAILGKESSYSNNDNNDHQQHYHYESSRHLQNQESNSNTAPIERGRRRREEPLPFLKRILIVDDDPDITLAFKIGLEDKSFDVYAYTDPL